MSFVLSEEGRHWKLTASRLVTPGSAHGSPSSLGSRVWGLTSRLQVSRPWHSASSRLMGVFTRAQEEPGELEAGGAEAGEQELLVSLY